MRITTSTTAPERATADVLAVAVGKPPSLTGAAAAVDRALGGTLGRLIESGEIRGAKGQVTVVHAAGGVRAKRVAVVGLGASPGPAEVRLAAAGAVRAAAAARAKSVAFALDGVPLERDEATRCVVDGGALAGYRFTRYLTSGADDRPGEVGSLSILGGDRAQARLSVVLTEATNRARDLQNTPPRDMGPQELAERAKELAKQHPSLTARVHDRAWMERRGMGLFLAVAQGSSKPAAHDRPSPQAAQGEGRRRPRARRQGADVRLGRLHAEAGAGPGRDEVRHVGRGGRARGDRRHRRARASRSRSSTVIGATENMIGMSAVQDRRHRHRGERQDGRDQQHRRRGPARPGRLPAPRALARRDPRHRPRHPDRARS